MYEADGQRRDLLRGEARGSWGFWFSRIVWLPKIVDVATLFFKGVQQTQQNDFLTASYESEFESIASRARELYSDKLLEVPLATKLDKVVRELTPKTKSRAKVKEEHRRHVAKSRNVKDLQHVYAYPSPERSPERSPEPSPEQSPSPSPSSSIPVADAARTTSRKRRNSDRGQPRERK
jgi:hypothetical protein